MFFQCYFILSCMLFQKVLSTKTLEEVCLRTYQETISSLVGLPFKLSTSTFDVGVNIRRHYSAAYAVGPIELQPSTYHAMIQLNITLSTTIQGVNSYSTNCLNFKAKSTINSDDLHENVNFVDGTVTSVFDWIDILNTRKYTKFVLTTGREDEWLKSKLLSCASQLSKPCTIPLAVPFTHLDKTVWSALAITDSTSLATIKGSLAAYYSLVRCVVPVSQLFVIDSSTAEISLNEGDRKVDEDVVVSAATAATAAAGEYWCTLSNFLGISVSSYALSRLSKAGIPVLRDGQCFTGSIPCMYSPLKGASLNAAVPSLCSLALNVDLVQSNDRPDLQRCAVAYADQLSTVVGQQYRHIILQKLLRPIVATQFDSPSLIILNVAPGSSGSKSIYTAFRQLNITSRHYSSHSSNCSSTQMKLEHRFNDDLHLISGGAVDRLFWGDYPVSERWWHLLLQYPATTRMLMSDMDSNKWYHTRLTQHCSHTEPKNDCTPPIPFSFYRHNSRFFNSTEQQTIRSLLNHTVLTHITTATSHRIFEVYRSFVKCVVPSKQLLWVDLMKLKPPQGFWADLAAFAEISLPNTTMRNIVDAGIPYLGSKGCTMNKKPCRFASGPPHSNRPEEVLQRTGAIIPSVCVPQ